jgi:hypothetical protein
MMTAGSADARYADGRLNPVYFIWRDDAMLFAARVYKPTRRWPRAMMMMIADDADD